MTSTTNTLDQIKQAEADGQKIIDQARQKVENLVLESQKTGERNLNEAQNQVTAQIETTIEQAKKEIQDLKTKNEQELNKALDRLNGIDGRIVEQAAKVVIDSIVK